MKWPADDLIPGGQLLIRRVLDVPLSAMLRGVGLPESIGLVKAGDSPVLAWAGSPHGFPGEPPRLSERLCATGGADVIFIMSEAGYPFASRIAIACIAAAVWWK